MAKDPFCCVDEFGVGSLVNTALTKCDDAKVHPRVSIHIHFNLFDDSYELHIFICVSDRSIRAAGV